MGQGVARGLQIGSVARMTDEVRRWPRWAIWTSAAVFTVGVLIGSAAWWFWSDGDLPAVRAEAEAMGLPTDPAQVHWEVDADRRDRWLSLPALTAAAPAFLGSPTWRNLPSSELVRPRPGWPISDALVQHHAGLAAAGVDALEARIDALGTSSVVLGATIPDLASVQRARTAASVLHSTAGFLSERVLVADPALLDQRVRRLIGLLQVAPTQLWTHLNVRLRVVEHACKAIAYRSSHLSDRAAIAKRLVALAEDLDNGHEHRRRHNYALIHRLLADRSTWATELRKDIQDDMAFWTPLIARRYRAQTLRTAQATELLLRGDDVDARLTEAARAESARRSAMLLPDVGGFLSSILGVGPGHALRQRQQLQLAQAQCLALAAWLTDREMPADPYDPERKPLRPLVRDGRTIGAYSLGRNGIDDHGAQRVDVLMEFGGAMQDPPKVPVIPPEDE